MTERHEDLANEFIDGRVDRRAFLARATALGLSTSAIAGLLAKSATAGRSSARRLDLLGATPPKRLVPKVKLVKRPGDKKVKIAFDLPSQAQLRWRFDQKYFQAAVNELGDTVSFQNAADDAQKQATQIENFIVQKPDVIVMVPVDIEAAATLATQAAAAKIPIVSYNQIILKSSGVTWWVARDNVAVGRKTAQLALKARPHGNYVIASGDEGTDVARDKTKGYIAALKGHSHSVTLVSQQFNQNWDPALGQAQIQNMYTKYNGKLAAILCNYDGFSLAALQVLHGNKGGKVWIGGEDVFPQFANAIALGTGAMSFYTDLEGMARYAAQAAHDLGNGRKPTYANDKFNNGAANIAGERVASFPVTKANMCQFIKQTGWVTYNDTYKGVPVSKRPKC